MKSLAPNTLLQNRYLIVQLIGKGGMGEVYLAVDQRLGSAVALKRMLFSEEEALGNAFEREAKILARLRHPALTKVSDHFTENETQYLVMEHISGEDLAKRLEQNQKPFPLSWVLFWADQLLDALTYLHSHEPPIIHRDIKPQNLKLTNENHIILLDFGLAKNESGETRLSTTGDVIAYTPHYASMEQIRGTGTTGRSDIYSLCATIYQLLTNSTPPDALTRADSVLNSLPDPVQPLNELNPEVSPALAQVIIKGMSLSAEQRFANAKDMQTALREAYSKIQKGMSADTVAFNINDELPNVATTPEIKQSEIKTEVISTPDSSQPVGEKTEVMPINLVSSPNENPVTISNDAGKPKVDATLPFVTPLVFNENENTAPVGEKTELMPLDLSPAIGEKTEVMPFDSLPTSVPTEVVPFESNPDFGAKTVISPIDFPTSEQDKTNVSPIDFPISEQEKTNISPINFALPTQEKTEIVPIDVADITAMEVGEIISDVPENGSISQESFKSESSLNPQGTVPMVNFSGHVSEIPAQDSSNNVSIPHSEIQTQIPPQEEVKIEPKKKAAVKGGGSKVLIILGVLAILGFLAIGAAGVGLYVLKPELFTSATPTPKPTIEITPTITPTVTPTVEENLGNNTNIGNTNGDFTNTNTNSNTDEEITGDNGKTPRQTERPVTPTPGKITTPTPNKQNTPKTKTPTPQTPTPVKQVTPDRKRIEQ